MVPNNNYVWNIYNLFFNYALLDKLILMGMQVEKKMRENVTNKYINKDKREYTWKDKHWEKLEKNVIMLKQIYNEVYILGHMVAPK